MENVIRALRLERLHAVLLVFIAILLVVGHFSNDNFMSMSNFSNVQEQMVTLAIVALAQSIVILSAGIDLSYAGMISLFCVIFAHMAGASVDTLILAVLLVAMLGIIIGGLQGTIIAYLNIHPLIVTIGGSTILMGLALFITKQPTGSVPIFFEDLAYEKFFGLTSK